MGRLKIKSFVEYSSCKDDYDYANKSAEKIEEILNGLGLLRGRDYSITSTPALYVDIYFHEKSHNKCYSHLYLNDECFGIGIGFGFYPWLYLSIYFYNNGRVEISEDGHFAILTNYFHSIRDFIKEIFKYLEECYQNRSVDLKNFTKFFLKNYRNFVEERKKELDEVEEILNMNKKFAEEIKGDFRYSVISKQGIIRIDSQKKVSILEKLRGYNYDEVHRTLSKIERLLKYGKFKEGLDEIPFVRRLKEIKQKLE